jgi:hypothetical protein
MVASPPPPSTILPPIHDHDLIIDATAAGQNVGDIQVGDPVCFLELGDQVEGAHADGYIQMLSFLLAG